MKPTAPSVCEDHVSTVEEHPLHILIIEDNEDCRLSLRDLLRLHGHRVDVAVDGLDGVDKALQLRPGVALVDINMPGLNGYEVSRRLREEFGDRIVLIACTAYGQAEYHQEALDAGFDALRVKPVEPDQLLTWLRLLG